MGRCNVLLCKSSHFWWTFINAMCDNTALSASAIRVVLFVSAARAQMVEASRALSVSLFWKCVGVGADAAQVRSAVADQTPITL